MVLRNTIAFSILVACLVAAPSIQADTSYVGVFGDPAGTVSCMHALPGVPTTAYALARVDSALANGITGAAFRIELQHPTGYFVNYTAPSDAIVLGSPLNSVGVNITFATCHAPSAGIVQLGTIAIFNTGAGGQSAVIVAKRSPPSNPNYQCAILVKCDAPLYSKVCVNPPQEPPCLLQKGHQGINTAADEFRSSLNEIVLGDLIAVVGTPGHVFAYGVELAPPYTFSTLGDTLLLNGVPYLPLRSAHSFVVQLDDRDFRIGALLDRAKRAAIGHTGDERLTVMAGIFQDDSLVTNVETTTDGLHVSLVSGPGLVFMRSLGNGRDSSPRPTIADRQAAAIDLFKRRLDQGNLVAFGAGYDIVDAPSNTVHTLEIAGRLNAGLNVTDQEMERSAFEDMSSFVNDVRVQGERARTR